MIPWLYRWLPIFFGCHGRDDRSFHIRGRKFPICARCTGELAGMVLSLAVCLFWRPPAWACLVIMLPMITDGSIQMITRCESTNLRRVTTGFLFGYALIALVVLVGIHAFRTGYALVR